MTAHAVSRIRKASRRVHPAPEPVGPAATNGTP